jgi:hypothetical protein
VPNAAVDGEAPNVDAEDAPEAVGAAFGGVENAKVVFLGSLALLLNIKLAGRALEAVLAGAVVVGGVSLATAGDPKLNPPVGFAITEVAVVAAAAGVSFFTSADWPNLKPASGDAVNGAIVGLASTFAVSIVSRAAVAAAVVAGDPNEKPPVAGLTAVVSGLAAPNANPFASVVGLGPPNEKPPLEAAVDVGAASLGVEELVMFPNVNPPAGFGSLLLAVLALLPKLKPPDAGIVVVAVVVDALVVVVSSPPTGVNTPNVNFEAAGAPNENCGTFSDEAPGLACSQHAHLERELSLRVIQAVHSHLAV